MVDLTENHPPHFTVTVNTDAYLVVAKQSVVLVSTDFASAVADFLAVIYATEEKDKENCHYSTQQPQPHLDS